jgi:cell division protein FtsQ
VGLKEKRKNRTRRMIFAVATVFLGTAVFFSINIMRSACSDLWQRIIVSTGFIVKAINVSGVNRKSASLVLEGLAIRKGESMLKMSAKEICQHISSKSFVKSVIVSKNLPNIININIVEKEPIAIFQQNSKFFLIDKDGEIIEEVSSRERKLPVVIGDGSNLRAMQIVNEVSRFKYITSRIERMILVRKRRWDLVLIGGIRVKLPKKNVEKALEALSTLLNKDCIRGAKTIDLRIDGDIIISGIRSQNSDDGSL